MKNLLYINFYFIFFSLIFTSIIFYFSKFYNYQLFFRNYSVISFIRFLLLISLVVSFFIHLTIIWLYINYTYYFYGTLIFNNFYFIPEISNYLIINIFNFNIYLTVDLFGLILLFLAYVVGFISILALDTRLYWKNIKYIFSFNIFVLIVYFYVSVSNLLLFFLFYECLLLPSFLFVYFVSPSRRAIQASLYFVIWTQLGSFLVLCSTAYIIGLSGLVDFFNLKTFNFTSLEGWLIYLVIFLGFGFKVPIWPFHYWLTKTHVEAPSGFSIYLSGFLVKSALYGFYKITNIININIDTTLFIVICMFGVIDSSLKMWGQTDLKKLVAYGTIQEMNLIYLVFCWGDSMAIIIGIIFSATHAFLSALMFFLVDCIYRRFHTRSLVEINGILQLTPNLGISILLMCIFFAGLPGTIKFISEFYLFSNFLEISPFACLILMFLANVLGLIGFSKCWFNAVFGLFRKNSNYTNLDLSFKEIYIIFFSFFFLFFFSYFINFIF